jgi:hypothetical protein
MALYDAHSLLSPQKKSLQNAMSNKYKVAIALENWRSPKSLHGFAFLTTGQILTMHKELPPHEAEKMVFRSVSFIHETDPLVLKRSQ